MCYIIFTRRIMYTRYIYIYIVYIIASVVLFPLLLLAVSSRTKVVVVYCGESRQHQLLFLLTRQPRFFQL